MSKIKLEGNASGTGTLTISAPNTNTDRSLTLPDTAGEFVTADASGNVGIGTSSPDKKLEIVTPSADTAAIKITDQTDATASYIGQFSDVTYISNNTTYSNGWSADDTALGISSINLESGAIILSTDSAGNSSPQPRMRIDTSGNLLVGKTSADGIAGSSIGVELRPGGEVQATRNHGNPGMFSRRLSDGNLVLFRRDTTSVGSISVTSSSTSYNTSSDYRLKENVVDIDGAIDRVKALQPRRFNFIANADTTVDGFIAHEVSDVVPEAITGEKDATKEEEYEVTPAVLDDDGNVVTEAVMGTRTVPDYQGIDQSKLVPLLTGALQEAIAKIEALETRIEALENA